MKIVKDSLHKVIHNAKLNFEELNTILVEIESMMNSRPLTYLTDDEMEALTPYHLLHGRNIRSTCSLNLLNKKEMSEHEILTKRVTYVKLLIENYWNRFYHEYTVALRERTYYDKTKRSSSELHVGDVVLIKDDKFNPRNHWRRGRVVELLAGRDSIVRGAKLSVSSRGGKQSTIFRPLTKLIPLEITKDYCVGTEIAKNVQINDEVRRKAFVRGQLDRRTNDMS